MIFLILSSSFCTGCIHHGSISQAAHSRIHPQLWTGLFYNVLQIRRRSADLALLIQINHSGNGSFPVSGNASACSRYGPFRCPCCLSDNAVHVQGIPGGRFHTYKRLHHDRGPVSPDSLQRPCPLFHRHSHFLPGKIEHTAIRNRTYKYIRTFPVYTGIGTVCMHDRGTQHDSSMSQKISLRWDSVFWANDRQRLLIMPFDFFGSMPAPMQRSKL